MHWINGHIVSITVFLPLIASLLILGCRNDHQAQWAGLVGAVATFFTSCHLWYHFVPNAPTLQFVEAYEWLPTLGVKYIVGVDGLSILLVMLTTFLTPLVLLSMWHGHEANKRVFLSLIMALECGMLGALVAFDMIFFYVFWEIMLIPMYFIIGIWGGKNRIYATTKFVIYTVFGSLLMLVAAIVLYGLHFREFGFYSTSLLDLYNVRSLGGSTQNWLFLAFALAFAIKVPIWPFHTWLPHAHTEAPTAGSVILAGVLLKMGTYGFLRFAIPLFPNAVQTFAPVLIAMGVIGIIYGALMAWMQEDAKRMVAYSSVSHLGFVVVGSLALIGTELSPEAMTGAVYQMVNHGVSTGALFFLVGMIYERRHTRLLADFGGLAAVMPWFAVMLIVATLGSVGLPGTGGFVGEFLILIGAFKASPTVGILASLGVLLGAIYMLTLCLKVLFGPIHKEENRTLKDLSGLEFLYITPLAVLVILMGVWPNLFLDRAKASITHLSAKYQQYSIAIEPANSAPSAAILARTQQPKDQG